jgi:Ion channel
MILITNLMVGTPAMLLCLIVQAAVAFWCVRYYIRQSIVAAKPRKFLAGLQPLLVVMLAMMLANFVQIILWGTLFLWLGEFSELFEAVYHSAVNFASLGYGDIVMTKNWKLLGPLEAVNGVLMLGMTAAALMVILQHLIKVQRDELIDSARSGIHKDSTKQ